MSFELHSALGDADVTKTGFHHDFHDVQLADFDDAAQSFCFQPVQGDAVQKHDGDAGAADREMAHPLDMLASCGSQAYCRSNC